MGTKVDCALECMAVLCPRSPTTLYPLPSSLNPQILTPPIPATSSPPQLPSASPTGGGALGKRGALKGPKAGSGLRAGRRGDALSANPLRPKRTERASRKGKLAPFPLRKDVRPLRQPPCGPSGTRE